MLHNGFVLFLLRSHSYAVTKMKLWHVSTNSLGSKRYGYLIFNLRFEFSSCLGVVQSLLNRNDGEDHPQEIFQRPNGKWQMSNVRLRNWASTAFDSFHVCSRFFQASISPTVSSFSPIGRFQLGMGPKPIPFRTSFVPSSFKMAIIPSFCKRLCAARIHLFFQSNGFGCFLLPNACWCECIRCLDTSKKCKKHPTKISPKNNRKITLNPKP